MVIGTGNSGPVGQLAAGKYKNPDLSEDRATVPHIHPAFSPTASEHFDIYSSTYVAVEDSFLEAVYLSNGPALHVYGVEGIVPVRQSTCFHRLCAALGVPVPAYICRVVDLREHVLLDLQSLSKFAKVYYEYTSRNDVCNHVSLVSPLVSSSRIELLSSGSSVGSPPPALPSKVVGVTSLVQFFNKSNVFSDIQFYSGVGGDLDQFGADLPSGSSGLAFARDSGRTEAVGGSGPREQSVSDPGARHGVANLSSGVVRPRRRVVASKSKFNPTGMVKKAYVASASVQFNNLNEMFLDAVSRDYAQEILEQLFEQWGVDSSDPDAVKYAEDLVWAFIVATTASNKADYSREFDVPHKTGVVVVSFDVFSRVLAEGHGVTRRQFARGVADDMRRYVREPENVHLLPRLADRVGCDPQMAALAFDGSTHCTGLTSAELSFTKLLERRNLFEDDSVLAEGASQRLMQGMSSGSRSLVSR